MKNQPNRYLVLENDHFKDVMLEARELYNKAESPKYNIMNAESLKFYDLWSPYILNDLPFAKAAGFKVAFLQIMSIVMANRGEREEKDQVQKKETVQDNKIINFLAYKSAKNRQSIYYIEDPKEEQNV